jgi:hypothetical protein
LFTVNMPVGSGGNPSSERALLKVMPWLSVIIIESRYHGGGVLAVAEPLEVLLADVVGVTPSLDPLLDPAEPGLLTSTVQKPNCSVLVHPASAGASVSIVMPRPATAAARIPLITRMTRSSIRTS